MSPAWILQFPFPIHIPEVIEHHKENYEADVAAEAAAMEAASSSTSSSEELSEDDTSSLFSIDQMSEGSDLSTLTEISLLDFDADMDVVDIDDLSNSSDEESTMSLRYVVKRFDFLSLSLSYSLTLSLSLSHTHTHRPIALASTLSSPTVSRNNSLTFDQQATSINSPSLNPPALNPPASTPTSAPASAPEVSPSTSSTPHDSSLGLVRQLSPRKAQGVRTRQYFGQNSGYIMDAKTKGNVGRYINVSLYLHVR